MYAVFLRGICLDVRHIKMSYVR